ncbi:MAG: alpha/beta fold hydrolase [Anaerolineae bacterium]|jgi:pimeloyl-ACP methyl ester carboxylesterase
MLLALGIAGGILLLLIFVATGLCLRSRRIRRDLAAKYPAPGQLVDVGGYYLHMQCQGDNGSPGDPIVVMEAAEFSLSWDLVQAEVAKVARVCSYDRAGLGWSERGPRPRTVANIVEELHTLLGAAGVPPPYVLVGHSKGGMFVRLYAHRYPDEVAGMVLVDAAHEEQEQRFPASIARLNRRARNQTVRLLGLMGRLNRTGFLAPFLKRYAGRFLGTIPERVREMGLAVVLSDGFFRTVAEETRSLEEHFAAVRAAKIRSLGDIPLVVLTAVDQFDALEGQVPAEEVEQLRAVVRELQAELAALSPRGRQVTVRGSGHHIQIDQPQAVIDAIREVVGAAGQRAT